MRAPGPPEATSIQGRSENWIHVTTGVWTSLGVVVLRDPSLGRSGGARSSSGSTAPAHPAQTGPHPRLRSHVPCRARKPAPPRRTCALAPRPDWNRRRLTLRRLTLRRLTLRRLTLRRPTLRRPTPQRPPAQYFLTTPMTTPRISTSSTMIGLMVELAGWSRNCFPSR